MNDDGEHPVPDPLADAIGAPSTPDLTGLRHRLRARAEAEGLLDVAYRIVDTPFGPVLVAVTDQGVVRVAFHGEGFDAVLCDLADVVSPRILEGGRRTDSVASQLSEYFAGRRTRFDVALDLRLVSGFRHTVISQLPDIAYGSTATYAAVAARAGNPKAVRAVGSACARNPLPLVIPCHRVVRSDGSTGQYRGGATTKAALLAMEAAR